MDIGDVAQPGLFDEPAHSPAPGDAGVVLLAGPSGSGKTSLSRRLGLPVLQLDDFYRDADGSAGSALSAPASPAASVVRLPSMPHRFGIVDWDDAASWDAPAAMAALVRLSRHRAADVPVYDIPTSRRTGTIRLDLGDSPVVLAEGIFASELVAPCRAAGLLADAICLELPRALTFGRRLLRDLAESRKPPLTLVRRGLALARDEPTMTTRWIAAGCRPLSVAQAEHAIRERVTTWQVPRSRA